jgi:FHS family L-fucose permease-like MFS transporter
LPRTSIRTDFAAAFVLTVSLFALWGLGQALFNTLLPQFVQAFVLRGFGQALTQSVYAIVYFVGAIPAALYARRLGYKAGIILGLGNLGLGAFLLYPAAEMQAYPYFLFAVILMSCGWIMLEVAANPLVASFGSVKTSVQRLNLAQSFFPLGTLLGFYAAQWLAVSHLALPSGGLRYPIAHPYILIAAGVMVLMYLVGETRFPPVATERSRRGMASEFRTLLSRPHFLFGIAAQFFCVLALAGTWTVSDDVFAAGFPGAARAYGVNGYLLALAMFAAGRFAGSALMIRIRPERLLAGFAGAGFVLAAVATLWGGATGAIAMLGSCFFLSITWPTVLGIAIRGQGQLMKLGTALICMGGAVGGVVYQMLRVVWSLPSGHFGMLVPACSYLFVLAFALASHWAPRENAVKSAAIAASDIARGPQDEPTAIRT